MEGLGGWWCGRMGDTEKADMPSGRLAFATRRVNLMAASMRAPLALCADGMTILPHKAWEKLDQMVVRVQLEGAPIQLYHTTLFHIDRSSINIMWFFSAYVFSTEANASPILLASQVFILSVPPSYLTRLTADLTLA